MRWLRSSQIVVAALALVLILWMVLGLWLPTRIASKPEERAAFGEMFGAVNALFAGLAFVGIIWAIRLQSKELQLQRRELRDTRAELAGQKQQLELQNATMRRQTFENTFFQLLRLHHDIVAAIEVHRGTHVITGREVFPVLFGFLRQTLENPPREAADKVRAERLNLIYLKFFSEYQRVVGHYFRNLYNIIKFVNASEVENKKFYTNLVRAQLSAPELLLLFYNCLSDKGQEKFKPLVEKFALLKTVPKEDLFEAGDLALYDAAAFAGT